MSEVRSILDGRCTIHVGDCIDVMRAMPANSVDCVVTSPPYWGLRDYGVDGQIGLEPTLGEHLEKLVEVFHEIWRILKQHGTVWLNYGDCYAAAPNGKSAAAYKADGTDDRTFRDKPFSTVGGVLKPKDLCMIPNRLAIALQEAGWWVRSEIIWNKPNPMPESVYDRPTVSHEKVFLLTKGEDYFYDHAAIREKCVSSPSDVRKMKEQLPRIGGKHLTSKDRLLAASGLTNVGQKRSVGNGETRNARNVWTIAPKAFREAHFATFPPALAERCIKAGTPKRICACCGAVSGCGPICEVFGQTEGVVFDPFGGAGTVSLVAEQLGLRSILVELNPEYADIAQKRIEAALPKTEGEAA